MRAVVRSLKVWIWRPSHRHSIPYPHFLPTAINPPPAQLRKPDGMLTYGCVSSWSMWAESWNEAGMGDHDHRGRACKQVGNFKMPVLLRQLLQGFQGRCFWATDCWIKALGTLREIRNSWHHILLDTWEYINKPSPLLHPFCSSYKLPETFCLCSNEGTIGLLGV